MNHLLMFAVLVASGDFDAHGKEEDREQMLTDVVKINGSMFKSYGCYCGVDGIGHGDPKDYIDVCCQILNCCYKSLKAFQCDATTRSYSYTYDGEDVECYTANHPLWCETHVCMCDRYFAICLLDSHGLFNQDFIPLGRRDCSGDPPHCSDS
ncbi:acidic phospholipase A2 2-like [Heteronotia binoei]|uniref:acidic phospholipase A2 2-like n=1 Tax=Heteronotia binoei TaxID=13085 RepID=UPI00292E7D4E|nr:acidic phospholipase A2 2-like [Heteronotia binoei]